MKKVILVVYESQFLNKKTRTDFEKKLRDDILIQHKDQICVEFFNEKDTDLFGLRFNKMLKKRSPDSAIFVDIKDLVMERIIRSIEERVSQDVMFFFKNVNIKYSTKATKVASLKEISLFLTAVKSAEETIV